MTDETTRRAVLVRGALALAGVTAVAGCTSGGDGGTGGDTPEPPDEPSTATPAADTDSRGPSADHTVVVGPGGSLVFDPPELAVAPGDTVEFSWASNFHTVTVESTPSGSDWTGTGEETQDADYTHTHTFDVEGTYDYYCNPHRGSGMAGSITVGDGGDGGSGERGGGGDDSY